MPVRSDDEVFASLPKEVKAALLSKVGRCRDCGVTIVKLGRRERCQKCARAYNRECSANWRKTAYASVRYDHDPYISNGRRGL